MLLKYTALPAQPVGLETCRPVESIGRVTIPDPFPQPAPISGRGSVGHMCHRTFMPREINLAVSQSGCSLP